MKILNLYSGLGGNRTFWNDHEITAVENNPKIAAIYQEKYPTDLVHVRDVTEYIKSVDLNKFDFIWSSPPCQTHSQMQKFNKGLLPIPKLEDIYGFLLWLPKYFENYFCIENVQPWYITPIKPTFRIGRHIFWSNFYVPSNTIKKNICKHGDIGGIVREKKTQDERNMVDPKIGKYILDQLQAPGLIPFFKK